MEIMSPVRVEYVYSTEILISFSTDVPPELKIENAKSTTWAFEELDLCLVWFGSSDENIVGGRLFNLLLGCCCVQSCTKAGRTITNEKSERTR